MPAHKSDNQNEQLLADRRKALFRLSIWLCVIFLIALFKYVPTLKNMADEWEEHNLQRNIAKKIATAEELRTKKTKSLEMQTSDEHTLELSVPPSYLAIKSKFIKRGLFLSEEENNSDKLLLSAEFPDLIPYEWNEARLRRLHSFKKMKIKGESPRDKVLSTDANYVGIIITSPLSWTPESIREAYAHLAGNRSFKNMPFEEKYGLRIYKEVGIFIPGFIKSWPFDKQVRFIRRGTLASPQNNSPMLFACYLERCFLSAPYHKNMGITVSFHASHMENWKEIWEKAQRKVSEFLGKKP
jgi:hypothetical protein